jgi:hypothetical protein
MGNHSLARSGQREPENDFFVLIRLDVEIPLMNPCLKELYFLILCLCPGYMRENLV